MAAKSNSVSALTLLAVVFCTFFNVTNSLTARKLEALLPSDQVKNFALAFDGEDTIFILGGNGDHGKSKNLLKFSLSSEVLENTGFLLPVSGKYSAAQFQDGMIEAVLYEEQKNFVALATIPLKRDPYISKYYQFPAQDTTAFWSRNGDSLYLLNGRITQRFNLTDGCTSNFTSHLVTKHPAFVWSDAFLPGYLFGGDGTKDIVKFFPENMDTDSDLIYERLENKLAYGFTNPLGIGAGDYAYIFGGENWVPSNITRFEYGTRRVNLLQLSGMEMDCNYSGAAAVFIPTKNSIYVFGGNESRNIYSISLN